MKRLYGTRKNIAYKREEQQKVIDECVFILGLLRAAENACTHWEALLISLDATVSDTHLASLIELWAGTCPGRDQLADATARVRALAAPSQKAIQSEVNNYDPSTGIFPLGSLNHKQGNVFTALEHERRWALCTLQSYQRALDGISR